MLLKLSFFVLALLFNSLLLVNPAMAAEQQTEQDGWALGIEQRTVETSWYHHGTGGVNTYETIDLLGVKGEYQMPVTKLSQVKLDFNIGGTLFLIGEYTGERGASSYEGDARGFEVDTSLQAAFDAGAVQQLGRIGGSVLVVGADAASDSAASPYDEDFSITIPEIYGAVGVKFEQFNFLGVSSASLMYRFNLVDLGASTDYYIVGDVEINDYSNEGVFFTLNFRH